MKKIILLLTVFLAGLQYSAAQKVTVTGVVTSQEDGLPVIGASVVEKGTGNGVITDLDGNFSISVSAGSTLEFTYLGMVPQNRRITAAGRLNVVLVTDAIAISEVVVTAMGVKVEKAKLNIAVQSVSGESLLESHAANFVTALQGKVAGISVTVGGGSPNSGANVLIRGVTSLDQAQSNQPLYVMDGVAIQGGVHDINPADIESVTVLKGAAASALYGQQASNGVIMITTKRGTAGKVQVKATASWQTDYVKQLPLQQSLYGVGSLGFYKKDSQGGATGLGPPLEEGTTIYDNMRNYFKPGLYQKYDASLSGGGEYATVYATLGLSKHDGTVVNDYLDKITALFKADFKLAPNLTANLMLNTTHNTYRGGDGIQAAYTWPMTDDIRVYDELDGSPRFRYFHEKDGDKYKSPINPLYGRYNDHAKTISVRNLITAALVYEPIKNLKITGRLNYETVNSNSESHIVPRFSSVTLPNFLAAYDPDIHTAAAYLDAAKRLADYGFPQYVYTGPKEGPVYDAFMKEWADSKKDYTDKYNSKAMLNESDYSAMRKDNDYRSRTGYYSRSSSASRYINAVGMINYTLNLPKDINLEVMVGGELVDRESRSLSTNGYTFLVPGTYALTNTDKDTRTESNGYSQRRMAGIFGELRADYKGIINLSVTGRADWTSTMYWKYMPYYYPSITGGVIFSELFNLKSDVFSFGKLRANWARTGKDANAAYIYGRNFAQWIQLPDQGYGYNPSNTVAIETLQPEMYDSWEIGADLRFFNSRTRLDVAWYETDSRNQILGGVRSSAATGVVLQTLNGGWINNRGIETTLEQDIIKNRDFLWTAALNFGLNRGTVKGLPDGLSAIPGIDYGTVRVQPQLHGSPMSLYGKDYLRTDDGEIIVDENGYPRINTARGVDIGNREPDFLLGFTSNFAYKNITLGFLFDGRKGGAVYNRTAQSMMYAGMHRTNEVYRGRQVVWKGVVQTDDGYKPNTTPINLDHITLNSYYYPVDSNFVEDGSYIRLSYVTIGYDLSKHISKEVFKSLKLSLTARNLFLLTRYTGSDPQINADTSYQGTGSMGVDNYPVPSTRSFNFTLSATF